MVGRTPAGTPDRRTVYGKTRAECQGKLEALRAAAVAGTLPSTARLTFGDFLWRWLRDSVRPSVRPRTYDSYAEVTTRHIAPALGGYRLTALRPEVLQQYYAAKLEGGLSATTVKYHHAIIHRALKQALKWDLVRRNVAEAVDAPRPGQEEMCFLTPDQASELLASARATGDRLAALWGLALYSGARQGELLALRWADVDLAAGRLRIRRALERVRAGAGVYAEPKTASSRRTLTLDGDAVALLREHRARQAAERLQRGAAYADEDLVFCTQWGGPLDRFNVRRDFRLALGRAGLPLIRFHDLRHTNGVLMQLAGVGLRAAMARLGHAQARTTLETYGHITPQMDVDAAARIAATLRDAARRDTRRQDAAQGGAG
jgi:integrase